MVNLHTKFEVSVFTHYEFGVVCGGYSYPTSPAMSPFDRVHMTSYLILIEIMRLFYIVFEL